MTLSRRPGLRRAAYNQRAAIATELIEVRAVSVRGGGFPDGNGTDGYVGDGINVLRINPPVGQIAAVAAEIIDHRGLIENLRDLGRGHTIAAWVRVAEMLGGNKRETVLAQAPVESDADCTAPIKETDACLVGCSGRKRGPAAVTI